MLKIKNLCKSYGNTEVLHNINFHVAKNEIVALLGKSGSGKSTLLRIIAGLDQPCSGSIEINGKVGMVFQDFQLFPHMTVMENLLYVPVKILRQPKNQAYEIALDLLKKIGLIDKENSYPKALSGGQKQRVAIARTLMVNPDLILFDEPTSALDAKMSVEVMKLIKEVADNGFTIIIVSHDIETIKKIVNRKIYI